MAISNKIYSKVVDTNAINGPVEIKIADAL